MTPKLVWKLLRQWRKVYFRALFFAFLGVATAAVAQTVAPYIPQEWTIKIGAEAVDQVLNILASSMLAVTTFSLGIAISAFAAAASNATPRATALLQKDPTAQNVLATFLGAFLFSLVGIVALQGGYYSDTGRLVLFVATVAVIAAVVGMLLRWISHLMTFGRMADTLTRVENAASNSLARRLDAPFMAARPIVDAIPETATPVFPDEIGYVQYIDVESANARLAKEQTVIWLAALPGTFVHEDKPLFHIEDDSATETTLQHLRSSFVIAAERDFDQDPRFGLIVMSEIASRALSPGVNDPGTAISVIGRLVRILAQWKEDGKPEAVYRCVYVPGLDPADLIDDAFRPIVRDGADNIEVQIRLHKALQALGAGAPSIFGAPAAAMAREALGRAEDSLPETEYELLRSVHHT